MKGIRRRLVALLAVTALALATSTVTRAHPAGAFDYAQNGGFESGTASWLALGGTLDSVGADVVAPLEGSHAGRAIAAGTSLSLQTSAYMSLPPGPYRLSFALRSGAAALSAHVRVSTTDPAVGDAMLATTAGAGAWSMGYLDVQLSAWSDARVWISLDGATPGDVLYVDGVRLDGAPRDSVSTPTTTHTATPPASPTGTRTPTPTRTASPTRTMSPTRTATTTTTPAPGTGGLFVNGGFEDGDAGGIAGWERYGGSLSRATSPVRSGQFAARFESTSDSTKWLYQVVSVSPGSAYDFNAWVLDDDPAVASAFLRVSWYASDDGSGSALASADSPSRLDVPAPGFRELTTGGVLAPDGARSARLRVMLAPASAARAAIYIDDASFAPASADEARVAAAASQAGPPASAARSTSRHATPADPRELAAAPRSTSRVVVNEVLYDPDTTGADAAGEWVELYNAGESPQDVGNWTISDAVAADALPSLTIPAHGYAIVAASDSFSDAYPEYDGPFALAGGRIGNSLGNDGDHIILQDAAGALVDAVSWGKDASILDPAVADVPAGHSIERRTPGADTDTAADFTDNHRPSPGAAFVADPANPQRQAAPPQTATAVLPAPGGGIRDLLPWMAAASALTLLVVAAAWRFGPALRRAVHRP